jgi:hypothetical protein
MMRSMNRDTFNMYTSLSPPRLFCDASTVQCPYRLYVGVDDNNPGYIFSFLIEESAPLTAFIITPEILPE